MAVAERNKVTGSPAPQPPNPKYILRGSGSPVTTLEFADHADSLLLSGCQSGTVHLWDLATRRSRHSFDAHNGQAVLSVTSPASDTLVTHGRDGLVKIWKCTGSDYVLDGKIVAMGDTFCSAVLLPPPPLPSENTSPLIAVPGDGSSVQLFDLKTRSAVRTLVPKRSCAHKNLGLNMCMCAVLEKTGGRTMLVVGYESGHMVLWDPGHGGEALDQQALHEDALMCLTYSSSSSALSKGLSGGTSHKLVAWNVSDEGKIKVVHEAECTNPGFNAVAIRPDDRIAAVAGWDKRVRIFSMKSLRPLAILAYHRENARCLMFSRDHLLAVGSQDHLISLWDIYRKKEG